MNFSCLVTFFLCLVFSSISLAKDELPLAAKSFKNPNKAWQNAKIIDVAPQEEVPDTSLSTHNIIKLGPSGNFDAVSRYQRRGQSPKKGQG